MRHIPETAGSQRCYRVTSNGVAKSPRQRLKTAVDVLPCERCPPPPTVTHLRAHAPPPYPAASPCPIKEAAGDISWGITQMFRGSHARALVAWLVSVEEREGREEADGIAAVGVLLPQVSFADVVKAILAPPLLPCMSILAILYLSPHPRPAPRPRMLRGA